jgi:peroxiredoxin-like protein
MEPFPHHYTVDLAGGPSGHGTLGSDGLPHLASASPPEFGGPGDAWSPEHLLLGSVATCFLFTFRAVANASKLPFEHLAVDCDGVVDRVDHVTRFTEIVLRPTLTLGPDVDRERAERLMEKAERGCLVTSSISTPVRFEPAITVEETSPAL